MCSHHILADRSRTHESQQMINNAATFPSRPFIIDCASMFHRRNFVFALSCRSILDAWIIGNLFREQNGITCHASLPSIGRSHIITLPWHFHPQVPHLSYA
ncbi:hypothetical protein, variant [Exophiala mesophila]|uniref:Uncharacterized protein n=1 Tax=Exophiala mesophila TaxID=212818 RepID=A0A0D1ZCT7_EXOME|nr:uncharacterized protein PV10_06271 [Exophiala mesophila]XP_016223339.1 hypothetical protein, variant [Exophiala mesophila]KIV91764.1 hypothetical protein PV10_06271 [Exophiala mesophila]KIV91765.1 hypothetical protein, variant [Exophiala mesophila]